MNFVVTNEQEESPLSQGLILSLDQDLGDNWGAFFRYDGTDLQTLSSPLTSSVSGGAVYRGPFRRSRDHWGVGLFRTTTEQTGGASEVGAETFYRFGLTDRLEASFTIQIFDPARAEGSFANFGIRFLANL